MWNQECEKDIWRKLISGWVTNKDFEFKIEVHDKPLFLWILHEKCVFVS